MASNDEDFDAWLDDIDSDDIDLDQDNIDELLSSVDPDEGDNAAVGAADKSSGELDQDNIDALLGLGTDADDTQAAAPSEINQEGDELDEIDSLLGDSGYDADAADDFSLDELDQDNIDALLAGSEEIESSAAEDDKLEDLAQDNIDALMAESQEKESAEGAGPAVEESQSELDQDDIDSLLGQPAEAKQATAPAENEVPEPQDDAEEQGLDELDQDNIDALFGDIDAASEPEESDPSMDEESLDELFAEEEAQSPGPAGVPEEELSSADADELAGSAFDSDLDEMDQLFADLDSGVDEEEDPFQAEEIDFAEMLGETGGDDDQEFIELDADETAGSETEADEFMAQAGALDESEAEAVGSDKESTAKKGLMIPALLSTMNKGLMAGIGGGVALLLLLGLYFLFSGPEEAIKPPQQAQTPATPQQPVRKMAENFVPVSEDAVYDMGSEAGEMALELSAVDKDDQPLIYEITSKPQHGRLSGTAPHLTYLPDNTFPGEDRFEFTVSDGTDNSDIAVVTITGPDLATLAQQKEKKKEVPETAGQQIISPKKPRVAAKDATYFTVSTGPVTIDWARLWQEANHTPYLPKQVHVEIVDAAIHGDLERRDTTSHIFRPDPYRAATDTIRYRFKKGGFRSATKTVTIDVELGSPPPEINIARLNDDGYLVGQKVIIDASASRDEARDSLRFYWEQVAGVEIGLRLLNEEGSIASFTMPSSFYTSPTPGPTIAVTAVDNTGKETRQAVKVKMISRRQTALWRGEKGHVADNPPLEGSYFPWPFPD